MLVRGTLMGDEDAAPKIAVSQVQALEEVQVKLPSGVRIRINLDRATEEMLAQTEERRRCRAGAGQGDAASGKEGRVRGDPGAGGNERGGGSRLGGARGGAGGQGIGAGGGIETGIGDRTLVQIGASVQVPLVVPEHQIQPPVCTRLAFCAGLNASTSRTPAKAARLCRTRVV